jgi:hypothetical protein
MDDCGDDFQNLEEANESLRSAFDNLANADSILDGGHAAADVLQGIGDAMQGTIDGVCMENLGDQIEAIGRSDGELTEATAAVIGEIVELTTETSLAVSEPLVDLVGELFNDAGDAVHSAIEAVEHTMAGELGEAGSAAVESLEKLPEFSSDVVSTLPEVFLGAAGEVIEGAFEIGAETIEGLSEISGINDDNIKQGEDHE